MDDAAVAVHELFVDDEQADAAFRAYRTENRETARRAETTARSTNR